MTNKLMKLRIRIGASFSRMAELLGLSGGNAADTVRKWESGAREISGTAERLVTFMMQGVGDNDVVPPYLFCTDLDRQGSKHEFIIHTRYPRFVAVVTDERLPANENESLVDATDGLEWVTVFLWVDEPVDDPQPFVTKAAEMFGAYNEEPMMRGDDGIN